MKQSAVAAPKQRNLTGWLQNKQKAATGQEAEAEANGGASNSGPDTVVQQPAAEAAQDPSPADHSDVPAAGASETQAAENNQAAEQPGPALPEASAQASTASADAASATDAAAPAGTRGRRGPSLTAKRKNLVRETQIEAMIAGWGKSVNGKIKCFACSFVKGGDYLFDRSIDAIDSHTGKKIRMKFAAVEVDPHAAAAAAAAVAAGDGSAGGAAGAAAEPAAAAGAAVGGDGDTAGAAAAAEPAAAAAAAEAGEPAQAKQRNRYDAETRQQLLEQQRQEIECRHDKAMKVYAAHLAAEAAKGKAAGPRDGPLAAALPVNAFCAVVGVGVTVITEHEL